MGNAKIQTSYNLMTAFRAAARLGPFLMPSSYKVRIDDDDYPFIAELYVVMEDGRPVCEQVHLERREGGPPIDGATLRLPLVAMLRHTAAAVALRVDKKQKGKAAAIRDDDLEDFYKALRTVERAPGRRPITDEMLRHVAKIYRDAGSTGSPVAAVKAALDISRSHAGRLVMRARRSTDPETGERFLGQASPGRAGEGGKQ